MTSEREQREFDVGLREEVDGWLRGDTSRRTFLERLAVLGGAAALAGPASRLAGLGVAPAYAAEGVDLASPDTPLGKAQAAAIEASTKGPTDGSAYRAVEAAQEAQRRHPQHDLRGRPSGARAAQLLGPALEAADGHRLQRRRAPASRSVLQADRRAHRPVRRLRHPRHRAVLDSPARQWRRDRADRRLCRQVHEQGGSGGLPSALQVDADLQGQALGRLRRRRRVCALLPQGHLRATRS